LDARIIPTNGQSVIATKNDLEMTRQFGIYFSANSWAL